MRRVGGKGVVCCGISSSDGAYLTCVRFLPFALPIQAALKNLQQNWTLAFNVEDLSAVPDGAGHTLFIEQAGLLEELTEKWPDRRDTKSNVTIGWAWRLKRTVAKVACSTIN